MEEFPKNNGEKEKDPLDWTVADFEQLRKQSPEKARLRLQAVLAKLTEIYSEIPKAGDEWSIEREELSKRIADLENYGDSF